MSWEQLKSTLDENRAYHRESRTGKPTACPIDGAILEVGKRGQLNCPFGNYRWPSFSGTAETGSY